MSDTERLLETTLPFVEDLLKKYGEFFPLASAVQNNDSISEVTTYDGNEKPLSNKVIADLKKTLKESKNKYKTVAIFYDVKAINPNTNIKSEAVAIFIEQKTDSTAYTLYYPYILTTDKKIKLLDPWKSKADKEIFN